MKVKKYNKRQIARLKNMQFLCLHFLDKISTIMYNIQVIFNMIVGQLMLINESAFKFFYPIIEREV